MARRRSCGRPTPTPDGSISCGRKKRYLQNPELLREEIATESGGRFVVIDEVQKVPQLLDEVHWLIENRGTHFALCGSSARKVRRGHANLLVQGEPVGVFVRALAGVDDAA